MSRVCVVVPCNQRHYAWLPLALKSIAVQSFQPHMVSIALTGFERCDPIPYVPSYGLNMTLGCATKLLSSGAARNVGVERCGHGVGYYKFVDADDEMMPYQLERMMALMKEHNATHGRALRQILPHHRRKRIVHKTMHTDKHRAERETQCTIVILAFPTHCGVDCQRGNKHTQDYNVAKTVDSLQRFWLSPFAVHYPLTIFHEDYNETQTREVARWTRSAVFFAKIDLSPHALPKYLRKYFKAIMAAVKPAHRNGNMWLPSMRGSYHGFGYRMMCRFFAGLIMHHAALVEYTWYMRVDAGDSRLTGPFTSDPFVAMMQNKFRYGYQRIAIAARNARFDRVIANWTGSLPHTKKLLEPFLDRHRKYNGHYYYNNFEVVHLPTFRSPRHQWLFNMTDRAGAFMLGDTPQTNLGDADFRSVSVAFLMAHKEVHRFSHLPYAHPVPWDALYP